MNAPAGLGSTLLDSLVQVIGEESTLRLARTFGGTALYVPRKLGANHPITAAIGADAATSLVGHYAGETIDIPRGVEVADRQRRVRELAAQGRLTRGAIARETGLSQRRVYQILAADEDEQQLDLFDPRRGAPQ